jgi:hypothetical protein
MNVETFKRLTDKIAIVLAKVWIGGEPQMGSILLESGENLMSDVFRVVCCIPNFRRHVKL